MASKPKKPPAPFFTERREFLFRVLNGEKPANYCLEMTVVKKIFAHFENDLDFLSKVNPPSWMKGNSIRWFLTNDGKQFLDKKYKEFKFKIAEFEKCVDSGEKFGDDLIEHRPLTLRNFLNEQ